MKILVTGGAGFIGSHLVEALVEQGHQVTVLDNLRSGKQENLAAVKNKITFLNEDINCQELEKAMHGKDAVFHLAAIASVPYSVEHPKETHEVNATGTLNVLLAAKKAGVKKFIYTSTAAVYGDDPQLPKTETSPLKPQTPYALTKLAGENYVRLFNTLYGMQTIALRFFNVYGPRQDPASPYSGVITKFLNTLNQDKQPNIYGDGVQTRDFVYVKDVVQALVAALAKETTGVFNIGTGIQASINELLAHLNELLGKKTPALYTAGQAGDIRHSVADITAAQKILAYKPKYTLHEGLEETVGVRH
ncbi:SDR family oxidoreductase [Candidatus Woesearchaeota archaeon]|nr:SDR family oxidoreductase [Candidatus Woesearchaeota archaeon]